MNKEREIAEAIWDDLDDRRGFGLGSLKHDDPEIYEQIIAAHCEIIRSHLTDAAPSSAPQSESEAVRLLRELCGETEALFLEHPELIAIVGKVDAFLHRPPGPDWRTLAKNLWVSLREYTDCTHTPNGTVDLNWCTAEMEAIRDALASEASASGKGGE